MKNKKGFTLVELLAILTIISIILVITIPGISKVLEVGTDKTFLSSARSILRRLEYETVNTNYISQTPLSEFELKGVSTTNYDLNNSYVYMLNDKLYISLVGIGKFEGKRICNGTKDTMVLSSGECSLIEPSLIPRLIIDLDGGNLEQELQNSYEEGSEIMLSPPTMVGATFLGWVRVSGDAVLENGTIATEDDSKITIRTVDTTIKATWDMTPYQIVYNLNGGTVNLSNPSTYNLANSTITLNNPTKPGYIFTGWTGSNGLIAQTTVNIPTGSTGNKSYIANYEPLTYTISYNLNGGTAGVSAPTVGIYDNVVTISKPTKPGYIFTGWTANNISTNVAKYGTTSGVVETTWSAGTIKVIEQYFKNLKASAGTVTLTANWTPITYAISYNCNDGSGSTTTSTHIYGTAKALTESRCYKAPTATVVYVFIGWADTVSGTVRYTDTQSVSNLGTENNGTVTLYAKYGSLFTSTAPYTVLDDSNGNWRVKFTGTGQVTINYAFSVDVFVVGGGGSGASGGIRRGAGGGGYTKTVTRTLSVGTSGNEITIGTGGAPSYNNIGNPGGVTTAFNVSVSGGAGANAYDGGAGGSGGGSGRSYQGYWNSGGSNGSDGYSYNGTAGTGQINTAEYGYGTTEFNIPGAEVYSGGGGGATDYGSSGGGYGGAGGGGSGANSYYGAGGDATYYGGGGGGGGKNGEASGAGYQGIAIIRNHVRF